MDFVAGDNRGELERRGRLGEPLELRRWELEEDLDRALLAWALRFAFVTAGLLAERWGVSEQRMRARLRRLEQSGYLRRRRGGPNEPVRVVVTEAGAALVGLVVRTPLAGEPLGHELAGIKRVLGIERHFAVEGEGAARVLTERDMRRDEQSRDGRRWAVEVTRPRGRRGRRWPDYAVDVPAGRTAVELEFSLKGTTRVRGIVRGYLRSDLYEFVDFLVLERPEDGGPRRWPARVIEEERVEEIAARLPGIAARMPALRIVPWRAPLPHVHAGVRPFPPMRHGIAAR